VGGVRPFSLRLAGAAKHHKTGNVGLASALSSLDQLIQTVRIA